MFLFLQHSRARDWPGCVRHIFAKDFMNFISTRAIFARAKTIRAGLPQGRRPGQPQQPYAFLSTRDLRGLVAAMVD